MAILTEVRDPRVKGVTVIGVEMAPDMKSAKVSVSVMGDEKREKLSLAGLQNSAGFLQKKIADEIDMRYTPRLTFVLDKGVKNSLEIARILSEVLPKESVGNAEDDEEDVDELSAEIEDKDEGEEEEGREDEAK